MSRIHISVEGNIGAGKSTLLSELKKHTTLEIREENVGSWTYLEKYYVNPKKFAYALQEEILRDIKTTTPLSHVITERSALTSLEVFTQLNLEAGNISQEELGKLRAIEQTIPRPTSFVYLKLGVDELLARIRKRGRDAEKTLDSVYLTQVELKQEEFLSKRKEPLLLLDATKPTRVLVQETLEFLKIYGGLSPLTDGGKDMLTPR